VGVEICDPNVATWTNNVSSPIVRYTNNSMVPIVEEGGSRTSPPVRVLS
ncbi:3226_t:CDS:2, partial [Ambispora leptoticha]